MNSTTVREQWAAYWSITAKRYDHDVAYDATFDGSPSVSLDLEIGNDENIVVTMFESDCKEGPVLADYLESHYLVTNSSTGKILTVEIDINKDTILSSPLWTRVPPERGNLNFCVRAELRERGTNRSNSFYETKMIVQKLEVLTCLLSKSNQPIPKALYAHVMCPL